LAASRGSTGLQAVDAGQLQSIGDQRAIIVKKPDGELLLACEGSWEVPNFKA
jgi:hypothetical protein